MRSGLASTLCWLTLAVVEYSLIMRAETIAEKLFFATCRIEALIGDNWSLGTGFFYSVPTVEGEAEFIVTNRHVVEGATDIRFTFVNAPPVGDGVHVDLGRAFQVNVPNFQLYQTKFHPNPDVDVAVIPLPEIREVVTKDGMHIFGQFTTPAIAYGVEADIELDALEELVFIGYPNGLHDRVHYLPVMRRGTTATPIEVNHDGEPKFLMDAAVFPGSSGSPVFIYNNGSFPTRDGNVMLASRIALVGILAAGPTRSVFGEIANIDLGLGVKLDELIGIGIVYKAEVIDEIVQLMLDAAGIARISSKDQVLSVTEDESIGEKHWPEPDDSANHSD